MSASANHSGGHDAHPEPNYMGVFLALFVMTVLEIAVVYMPIAKLFIAILLVGFALAKAICVAAYFMHLKFEKRTLAIIAGTPLVLCAFLVFMLMPDAK